MKKNISINISGIIFHIEEDGYEALRKYLDSVNKYFAAFDDSSEILADIEGRIAEIFLSKLNDGKQVITGEDVTSLIATMGSVSDFKAAEEQEFSGEAGPSKGQSKSTSSGPTTPHKKLYRDQNRRVLGGVCSGLAHYFNVDPVWPRVIMALLFLSTGFFLIVYIVLWIAVPAANLPEQASVKKMYRDPDKKVIGGVASGVAAFFGADISLIRVLLVITFFCFGMGLILYIILWIALPEAKTITEKMQMQGEPVTLSNIETSVKKGLNEKDGTEENILTKIILFPFRLIAAILTGLGTALGPMLKVLLDVLRVAIGIVFTLTGVFILFFLIFAFGILLGMFTAPDWGWFSEWHVSPNLPLSAMRNSFPTATVIFSFLLALIPAITVLLVGSSIIVGRFVFNATIGWSLFVVFIVSAAVVSFSLPQFAMGFKEDGEYKVEEVFDLHGKNPVFKINETGMDDYDVTSLTLKGYDGTQIKLVERFQSQGPTRKVAGENAQMIEYHVVQTDSVLSFDSNITFKENAKFRAQRLDVDIFIPYNQPFELDAHLWRLIDTRVINNGEYYRFSLNQETQTWKITEKGLECVTCPPPPVETTINARDQFGLKDFNSIDLKGMFDVRIQRGEGYAVEITGSEAERKHYDVYVNGETLVIDYDDDRKFFWKRDILKENEIKITITMPDLRDLDVTGAGKVKFSGFEEDEVDIKLTGAVIADGDLNANTIDIELTGASFLDLSGTGRLMEADILGASGLRAYGFEVKHCIIEAHGASMAKVNVTETLEMKKGIASSISHRGNPEVIKR